mgnify:CR=1 FL=1
MSRLAWSTVGAALALSLILALADAGPGKIRLLLIVSGIYVALLIAGSLSPSLDFYLLSARRSPVDQPWIALTFDDGPDPAITPALLDLLRREHIPAAFFCVGAAARQYPALVAQAAADGHLIGNHSDRHGYGWTIAASSQVFAEFAAANQTLAHILGDAPRFVRTPAGVSRPDLAEIFAQLQLTNVAWDVRGLELLYRDPARIAARIARTARNGSIILLHETYYGTRIIEPQQALAIAQRTIARLRARGFRFVRLDQLLKQPDYAMTLMNADWLPEPGAAMLKAQVNESATTRYTGRT